MLMVNFPDIIAEQPQSVKTGGNPIHLKHHSIRTEQAYIGWTTRYIFIHDVRHPGEMCAAEVEALPTHLAAPGTTPRSSSKTKIWAGRVGCPQIIGYRRHGRRPAQGRCWPLVAHSHQDAEHPDHHPAAALPLPGAQSAPLSVARSGGQDNRVGLGIDQFTEKAGGVLDLPLLYLDVFSAWSELGLRE